MTLNLKESKVDTQKGLEGRKGNGGRDDYILISKNKKNGPIQTCFVRQGLTKPK